MPHECLEGKTFDLINSALKGIFEEVRAVNDKMDAVAAHDVQIKYLEKKANETDGDVEETRADLRKIGARLAKTESNIRNLRTDVDDIISAQKEEEAKVAEEISETKKQVKGYWWEVLKWVTVTALGATISHFPKIAKWAASLTAQTK